jgi:hypothetical protein
MRVIRVHIDTRTVLVAGLVILAFGVVANLAFEVADNAADFGDDSNWPFAFYAVFLVGLVLGGRAAGRARPDAPLAHGALAALAGLSVIAIISVLIAVGFGNGIVDNLVKLLAQIPALVAVAALTAYLVARRAHR